jgi:hypothetical protein
MTQHLEGVVQLMVGIIYKIAKNMCFTIRDISINFNAWYNLQLRKSPGSFQGGSNTLHRVVVSNCYNRQSMLR